MTTLMGNQQLPTMRLEWLDGNGAVIDLTAFTAAKVVVVTRAGAVAIANKTAGIVLAATSPNYVITWTAADITALTPTSGSTSYTVLAYAKRTADNLWDVFNPANPPALVVRAIPV